MWYNVKCFYKIVKRSALIRAGIYNPRHIINVFKTLVAFVISFFVCGNCPCIYSVFIPKTYQSSGMLYINSKNMSKPDVFRRRGLTDMYAAERLGENFKIILKTDKFLIPW